MDKSASVNFKSAAGLLDLCEKHNCTISDVMKARECEITESTPEENNARMVRALEIMKAGVREAIITPQKSMGGCAVSPSACRACELHKQGL